MIFFFLMNRPHPGSTRPATLFPYTTLFRSAIDHPRRAFIEIVDVENRAAVAREPVRIGRTHRRRQVGNARRLGARNVAEGRSDEAVVFRIEPRDRKSTRLNSSH